MKRVISVLLIIFIFSSPLWAKKSRFERSLMKFKDELISSSEGYDKENKYLGKMKEFITIFLKAAEDRTLSKGEMDKISLLYAKLTEFLHIRRTKNVDVDFKRVLSLLKISDDNIDYFFAMRDRHLYSMRKKRKMSTSAEGIISRYMTKGKDDTEKKILNSRSDEKIAVRIKSGEVENMLNKYYKNNKKMDRDLPKRSEKKKIEVDKTLDSIFGE